jgi:hypothetical protein
VVAQVVQDRPLKGTVRVVLELEDYALLHLFLYHAALHLL